MECDGDTFLYSNDNSNCDNDDTNDERINFHDESFRLTGDVKSMETQQKLATSAITNKDVLIMKLKSDLQLSKEHQKDVAKQLQYCENTIAELQTEISDFQEIVSMRVAETKNKEQSIQILQQLYKSSQEKVCNDFAFIMVCLLKQHNSFLTAKSCYS